MIGPNNEVKHIRCPRCHHWHPALMPCEMKPSFQSAEDLTATVVDNMWDIVELRQALNYALSHINALRVQLGLPTLADLERMKDRGGNSGKDSGSEAGETGEKDREGGAEQPTPIRQLLRPGQ
jgi:hypothetical protein